jgi:hypothetical protein
MGAPTKLADFFNILLTLLAKSGESSYIEIGFRFTGRGSTVFSNE